MKVTAIVVSHGNAAELEQSLPALEPQVDELLVIANVPGSVPFGVDALANERPLGFAANLNLGLARTDGDAVSIANPDAVPEPGAVAALRDFMAQRDAMRDRRAARWSFPTGARSRRGGASRRSAARSSGGRRCARSSTTATTTTSTSLRRSSRSQTDWMLGGFLLLRRAMLDELGGFDPEFRLYGEDIDLQYRAMLAGWERWYVPAAIVRHEHKAETDRRWLTRRTLWHWRGILRFVRKHPERLRSL